MSEQNNKNPVNLFIPCDMDMFSPNIPYSVISLLDKIGDECYYNENSTCCGRRFYFEGAIDNAKILGEKLMSEYNYKYPMVVPSSSCVGFIKNYYKQLFENVRVPSELKLFTHNVYELTDYIVNVKGITKLDNIFNHRVFYFKSCSARNLYKLDDEPETLLRNTKGLDLLTDPEMNTCCSANGRFAYSNPDTSDIMLEQIINKIYMQGAQYVTSTDIHCLQAMDAFIQAKGIGLEVIHIADILNGEK